MADILSPQRRTPHERNVRPGFTLIELSVSLVSSAMLIGGLASAIYISSQALDLDSSTSRQSAIASEVLGDLTADLALARIFTERTATAVTFDVPDRDGDLAPETIRYAWSGTLGDPLTYQYNGGTVIAVARNVQSLDLAALTRLTIASPIVATLPEVVFEEFTEAAQSIDATSITIAVPPGTSNGDLLIAAVAVDDPLNGLDAPAGWNLLDLGEHPGGKVNFGVWWKIASAAEASSYTFIWSPNEEAYGWIMRFTGHDPVSPIHQFAVGVGKSPTPTTPSVTTTIGYTMILRLGGFDEDFFDVVGFPGMVGHTPITMNGTISGGGAVSGSAAYVLQPSADISSGPADFTLTKDEEYRTVTIAIAPDPY